MITKNEFTISDMCYMYEQEKCGQKKEKKIIYYTIKFDKKLLTADICPTKLKSCIQLYVYNSKANETK